ncbi:hypothetical protein [Pararhizobium arenae]|uniref:hypothetical protein n=1 Tax=Pararhizobium arenae TaxID=1856850 RepID=UPI00094B2BE5|nr:hypothetical protein [Pararhizobium arenae]
MSNKTHLVRTIFQNVAADGKIYDTSYGFRIYDDNFSTHTNLYDTLEELLSRSPNELVETARGLDSIGRGFIEYAEEMNHAIIVDGNRRVYPGRNRAPSVR